MREDFFIHGGDIKEMAGSFRMEEDNIIDFSANINPFDLPAGIEKIIRVAVRKRKENLRLVKELSSIFSEI